MAAAVAGWKQTNTMKTRKKQSHARGNETRHTTPGVTTPGTQGGALPEPGRDPAGSDQSEATAVAESEAAQEEGNSIDALQAKVAALEDALLRAKADYQNLQRRSAIERAEAVGYANADLLRSLLGVLDDFDRAVESASSSENLAAVVDGVRLVQQNLTRSLGEAGLEPIEALHQPFDPEIHEAMLQQPTDEHPPGTVIEQIARGYRLRDRVLRPARVVVAKAPD